MTSLIEIYRRFPTREAATAHLEQVRWPHGLECVYCGATTTARHAEKAKADRWQCWTCHKSFSATVGTIFHNSHIDLQRWFLLIALMLNAKKGLSAMQAARDLEMRRPTVWSMMHRIRAALADDGTLLSGLVEMDEAYFCKEGEFEASAGGVAAIIAPEAPWRQSHATQPQYARPSNPSIPICVRTRQARD